MIKKNRSTESKYSSVDQVKFKGYLLQILFGPFMNILS